MKTNRSCLHVCLLVHFLVAMGIEHRVNTLLARSTTDEQRRALIAGVTRLVESPGMGSAFKAFAIAHHSLGSNVPGLAFGDQSES